MNRTTYNFEPLEMAVKDLHLDGIGPVTWLMCLGYEQGDGQGRYVGTAWSMSSGRPVAVGDRGEARRVMKGLAEASAWWRSVSGVRNA